MTLAFLVAVPAASGLVLLAAPSLRAHLTVLLGAAALHLGATLLLWTGTLQPEAGALLALDATGLLFLSIASVLFLLVALYTIPYLLSGTHDPQAAPRRFVPCLLWFLSAMTLVTVTQHLAVIWAAVEATTLASAPLIYFYRRKRALEATWKYLLICSVGIALALLGTFFLGIAASAAPGSTPDLTVSALAGIAPSMARAWLKASFVLALVGYGTKMGLAPMHTWLPDAHSQAPSPVSALLSGALLNCALLALLRFYRVCLASGDAAFAHTLLLVFGFASMAIACAFMVGQRDYKRLLAYSSIENMGVVVIGVGLGGAAVYGGMLHALNHSLCKAGLFFLAGNVLREFGSTAARDVRGLLRQLPLTGVLMTALLFAIGGAPPFGAFLSELVIFRAAVAAPSPWLGVLFVLLLTVAFLGMAGAMLPMLEGDPPPAAPRRRREVALSVGTPLFAVGGALMLGVYIPPFLSAALRRAAEALGG